MATDIVTIWNQSISAAGGRSLISAEDEAGREADLCRLWYPLVRDNVLKAASWPSAKRYTQLALLATRDFAEDWVSTDPSPTWKYAYAQPADLLAPRYLTTFARFDRASWGDDGVNALMTNQEDAVLHYVFKQEDVTKWDVGLEQAVVSTLAAQLAMPISGKVTRARELLQNAVELVLLAQTEIANESDNPMEALPSWVSVRGYDDLPNQTKFMFPYENLMAAGT